MQFTEILKPAYEAQQITIRLNDQDHTPEFEGNARATMGRAFPVIRIGNSTFMGNDVLGFHFSVGTSFLPHLSFRVATSYDRLKENLKTILDNITFYVGNNKDKHYVKLDMLVLDSSATKETHAMSMDCELYLPNLYNSPIRTFDTIKDALKKVCEECQMGLLMNYEPPELPEGIKIIQDGITNIELIQRLASYGSADEGTIVTPFIDQQMYLCMWEITKLFKDTTLEIMENNPLTGEGLDPKNDGDKLILSNQFYNEDRPFKIQNYVPISNYADTAKILPNNTTFSKTILHTFETDENTKLEHKKELLVTGLEQFNVPDELKDLYKNIAISRHLNARLGQFVKMDVQPKYMIPGVYTGMNVKLEIFNQISPSWYDDQENPDRTAESIKQQGDSMYDIYELRPNDLHSGQYYLAGIEWHYNGSERITQTLHLISKMSEDELETHLKA